MLDITPYVLPQYLENYRTSGGNTISMSRGNNLAKKLTGLIELDDVLISEIKKVYFTDLGPRTETTTNVEFRNANINAQFMQLEHEYQKELNERISNIKYNEPAFDTSKYFSPGGGGEMQYNMDRDESLKDYTRQLQNIYKEMGPSPKKMILNSIRIGSDFKLNDSQIEKKIIPTIQQGN